MIDTESKKASSTTGLPPGTLIHIGEKKTESTTITVIAYSEQQFEEKLSTRLEDVFAYADLPVIKWINVVGLSDTGMIAALGEHFHLHPLTQEDIVNTSQRPKIEEFDDYLFFVIKMLTIDDSGIISAEQVSIILADRQVISFQEQPGDVFDSIRQRLKTSKGRVRKAGADYLAYALLDAIVDSYFEVFEKIGESLEILEEELVTAPSTETLQSIYSLKRDLIYLRKSIWPLREVVSKLERGESELIEDTTIVYLKDVYDHVIQVADTLETYRDMVAGMLDIYLSSISNKMNEVMKMLTIIATIFIPLTFIAGLYGMNFAYMPELSWTWGYPMVLLVMMAVSGVMVMYFRKKRWL